MTVLTKHLIRMALGLATIISFLWSMLGVIRSPHYFVPGTGLFMFGLSIAYTLSVWDKIPFASANLHTALQATGSSLTVLGVAFATQIVALICTIIYVFASTGVYDHFQITNSVDTRLRVAVYIGFGLSYYWTIQTMGNVMQVCIASYINCWWFRPNLNSSERLKAIGESLNRVVIYSFGSVCFGSLFVGLTNILHKLGENIRPNREEAAMQSLVVVQEWIVSWVDSVFSIFHKFAFSYVGMYGYDFLEAGKKANTLFQKRGWGEIVADDLLGNIMLLLSIVIGGMCGCLSVIIDHSQRAPSTPKISSMVSFSIGFVVGLVLSNMLFSVITSSANAVVVCFAGSPVEFQRNHPECSHVMREAWRKSWPGFVDFVEKEGQRSSSKSPGHPKFKRESLESLFV
eukprot:CAMPEP_0197260854 /NCGR_PEP_ID=MMETSP1429-20130617/84247_1 /TAXON_ID=49237 /ORGANISM="Chaetoceros  sp., Strain UNC1202" /LENGTH=400 /DNA_ID=CAMNT_0042725103 /DNA_START=10 /DNA_END=1212 /DNA_ORIENTATION=+